MRRAQMQSMRPLCALFAFPALCLTAALSGCHAVRAMQNVVSGKETVPLPPDDSEKMSATPRRIDAPALLGPESSRVRTGILPPIRFDRDSHLLSKPATLQLRETATWLKGHPERVVIAGGAATGDPEYSRQLAEQRAIVGRLEALSAETGRLLKIYQSKVNGMEELKKSLLQRAFAGEL